MRAALARHDAIVRTSVEGNRGVVVKMTGDGVDAAFEDPLDAIEAVLQLQQSVADPATTGGIALRVRCGLHAGAAERRDDDYFGNTVNRAARIMSAAHGGQVLLSQAVAVLVRDRLPARVALRDLGALKLRGLANSGAGLPARAPAAAGQLSGLRSLTAIPNNLPQHLTSFVGRGPELTEIRTLLGRTRLLTLLGVGGHRQDSPVPGIRRRCHGRLSRRSVVRRAGAADRCSARSAGSGIGARSQGRGRSCRSSRRW